MARGGFPSHRGSIVGMDSFMSEVPQKTFSDGTLAASRADPKFASTDWRGTPKWQRWASPSKKTSLLLGGAVIRAPGPSGHPRP